MTLMPSRAGNCPFLIRLTVIVVLSLLQRRSLLLPRAAVARLHSSPILSKSKKSKNNSSNSTPSNNTNQTSSPSPIPSQSRLPSNEPSTEPSQPEGTSPSESPPPDGLSSSASAIPTTDPAPSTSAPPTPPNDTNPIYDEQYKAYRGKQTAGPFTWKAAALFVLTGTGLVIYFRREKERVERLRIF